MWHGISGINVVLSFVCDKPKESDGIPVVFLGYFCPFGKKQKGINEDDKHESTALLQLYGVLPAPMS